MSIGRDSGDRYSRRRLLGSIEAEMRARFAAHGAECNVAFSPAAANVVCDAARSSIGFRNALIDVLEAIVLSPTSFPIHPSVLGVRVASIRDSVFFRELPFIVDDVGAVILGLGRPTLLAGPRP